MSQFELESALREATRMDSSLNTSKAVVHKPRKALDNSSLNVSAAAPGWLLFTILFKCPTLQNKRPAHID